MQFQRLICLCLDRQPTDDLINGTMKAWFDAWTYNKVWDEQRDRPRFREAFVRFTASNIGSWPQPADILALLPPMPEQKALPVKVSDPARAQQYIDNLAKYLGVPTDKVFADPEKPST